MWNLYQNDKFLAPLKFSNGKTQEDIVKETLALIERGERVVFIHGVCGTGKSAVALNIAKEIGKTSIIVPGKNLQAQYKRDYEGDKYLLKENKEKLKISVITGRNNHKCKFLHDNTDSVPIFKKEINSRLNEIFDKKRKDGLSLMGQTKDDSADNWNIPCKIEIKEKNWNKLSKYLKQNDKVDSSKFHEIKDVKRVSVASVCPYWSPVFPEKYEFNGPIFKSAEKKKYKGVEGKEFIFYQRKHGCPFYEQFNDYIDSDVIVFNALKYKLEFALGRKPQTEIEIIDECDDFLDSFANQKNLNIDRLQNSLIHVFSNNVRVDAAIRELFEVLKYLKQDEKIRESIYSKTILPLKETGLYDIVRIFNNTPEILEELDEESYLFEIMEIAKTFQEYIDETYLTASKREDQLVFSLVTTNLAKKFKELIDKNKVLVLMSGTLHSDEVLKTIFGLDKFKVIEAEGENQGQIEIKKTGLEMDCKYSNLNGGGRYTRGDYLKALDKCVEASKKPTLVHVNAFIDLPARDEISEYKLENLMSREKLRELQIEDKTGRYVHQFKEGQIPVFFSTRVSRGADFPGTQCNSIIFTKYPNPNVRDAFWKILNKTNPQHYWGFYRDKAKRELWQKVYRGLRFPGDHVFVLSPDTRVLEAFENKI